MRLASITLPKPTGITKPWSSPEAYKNVQMEEAHSYLSTALLEWCQGYTRLEVHGVWVDGIKSYEEAGCRYEFTSPDTQTARDELVALAYRIKTISDEEAIFIVHANGETEIVR